MEERMKQYEVWFQDHMMLMTIMANDNNEARAVMSKNISIKKTQDPKTKDGDKKCQDI